MRDRVVGEAGRMARDEDYDPALAELLNGQDGVLRADTAMKYLTRGALRWRVSSGRWQQPCRSILVAQSGPLTEIQALRVAVLWAGPAAALAGLTAARLDGLSGFADRGQPPAEQLVHLLVPASSPARRARPSLPLVRRHRLPEPDRQAPRRDAAGRRRWLDAVWETARLIVEVDGIHHLDADQYWADMDRGNDFILDGYRILRFPAFVVRYQAGYVAGKIRDVLRSPGPGRSRGWADRGHGLSRTG
jgi:very-short-patch-repair endonuclease